MPSKVNIVIDDDVRAELERTVESGQRSRVVNRALRRELLRVRREKASAELDRLRARTRHVSTSEILGELKRDRRRA